MPRSRAIVFLVCAAAVLLPSPAAASITEFPIPTAQSSPAGITSGPDGALWFTEVGSGLGAGSGKIGRITTSGVVTEFPIPSPGSIPLDITTGPDGALWFSEELSRIGRITTSGTATEFPVPGGRRPDGIASGPDGALWFADAFNSIGRMTTSGAFTGFPIPATCCGASDIVAGPDGALWFTEVAADFQGEIDRIATNGTITRFPIPTPPAQPSGITVGPDGALWFTDSGGNSIGRLTTSGSFSEFPIRTPNSGPGAIVTGPDGALWFTENAGKIGRMTTAGAVTDFRTASTPSGIAAGPDGALWFTEAAGKIGRITTDQPAEDSIDGTLYTEAPCPVFQLGCTKPRYIFGASSTASGERAFGTVSYVTGERAGVFEDPGTVTCLSVHGNRATVGVNFASPPATATSKGVLIFVEDNGPAGSDRFAVQSLAAGSAPANCPDGPPAGLALGPGFPGTAGSTSPGVVITDAPAFPTTKAQCRQGGYRQFGFATQGRCVASVVHRAVLACLFERAKIGRPAFRRKYGQGPWRLGAFANCVRAVAGP